MRAVIYARYSSDLQSSASIEDQIEVCRRFAKAQNWEVIDCYIDRAQSGGSAFRPAFQKLIADLDSTQFEVVIAEAVDRLARKLSDIASFHDRLTFARVRLFTVSTGEVTAMHIGLLGTMAQLFLSDLREKTWRGMLGRARAGRVPGGRAYGYDVVEPEGGGRKGTRGERRINPSEASIVRRIFKEFAAGASPRAIAKHLNAERVPPPDGRFWNDTTIRGQRDRGTGILNNPIYIGRLEWNRTSYVKDPRTGKRIARVNPPEKREVVAVAALRIVDDSLWIKVKKRQEEVRDAANQPSTGNRLAAMKRQKFLLSGLLICGCCGGSYSIICQDYYGCRRNRASSTCSNRAMVKRESVERRVLSGIKEQLLTPEMVKQFITEFRTEWNRLNREQEQANHRRSDELASVKRKIAGIVRAVEDGEWTPSLKARLRELEGRRAELEAACVTTAPAPNLRLHPSMADLYRRKVEELEKSLNDPSIRVEATGILRSMIERITLTQDETAPDGMRVELQGDLAAILAATSGRSKMLKQRDPVLATGSVMLPGVAGHRTQRLRGLPHGLFDTFAA